ncbi:uncharacterized protein NEMAJ01_2154 [Nematocida major]|uniref:uncharacterized protein n=1 Tax=Nematocida major TaxID=1912982 RepID=UPI00200779B9|nr:uncharacterized protein NEMAJ01_2154 [Nematocida major]KAH9387258.1 hypothetical protein NEMAJ01_2154 [Nematocida major]
MYGEQERLYGRETVKIGEMEIEVYAHSNGVLVIPNTPSNSHAVKILPREDLLSAFTILEENEDTTPGNCVKYLYIAKRRHPPRPRRSRRRNHLPPASNP